MNYTPWLHRNTLLALGKINHSTVNSTMIFIHCVMSNYSVSGAGVSLPSCKLDINSTLLHLPASHPPLDMSQHHQCPMFSLDLEIEYMLPTLNVYSLIYKTFLCHWHLLLLHKTQKHAFMLEFLNVKYVIPWISNLTIC